MSDNVVTLCGTTTRDFELRFTQGGRAIASGGLAVNRRWQQNNEWKEEVAFFNLTIWSTLGENVAASIMKGTRVVVTGRLQQRSYETQSGEKRTLIDVVVDDMGPSMKWATAQVEKTQRSDGSGGGNQQSAEYGHRADPVYGDEEPF